MGCTPSLSVEVQGHTDAVGGDASNQKLSEARAAAVREWLTAHGIAATRITAHGYGKTHPVASNENDEGRARNRRVDVVILSSAAAGLEPMTSFEAAPVASQTASKGVSH